MWVSLLLINFFLAIKLKRNLLEVEEIIKIKLLTLSYNINKKIKGKEFSLLNLFYTSC